MEQYFSAPGRVELGGNHTDHQHGCVLAAAVDLEMRAAVTPNHDGVIRVFSQGFAPVEVALGDWTPRPEERNTTAALVRGMAAQFIRRGAALTGLDMRVTSQVRWDRGSPAPPPSRCCWAGCSAACAAAGAYHRGTSPAWARRRRETISASPAA